MPFRALRLLILFDDAHGYCQRVIPRMKELLEHRAFLVDVHRIQDGPIDITPYKGLVLGSPSYGFGIRGAGPTQALQDFVAQLPDLGGIKVAVFCVFRLSPGVTLDRMKGMVFEKGADLVVAQGYSLFKPTAADHVLPAECMVRIR